MTFCSSDKQPLCSSLTTCCSGMHDAMQSKLVFFPYNTILSWLPVLNWLQLPDLLSEGFWISRFLLMLSRSIALWIIIWWKNMMRSVPICQVGGCFCCSVTIWLWNRLKFRVAAFFCVMEMTVSCSKKHLSAYLVFLLMEYWRGRMFNILAKSVLLTLEFCLVRFGFWRDQWTYQSNKAEQSCQHCLLKLATAYAL